MQERIREDDDMNGFASIEILGITYKKSYMSRVHLQYINI